MKAQKYVVMGRDSSEANMDNVGYQLSSHRNLRVARNYAYKHHLALGGRISGGRMLTSVWKRIARTDSIQACKWIKDNERWEQYALSWINLNGFLYADTDAEDEDSEYSPVCELPFPIR
jgi:hypothetical protein